MNNAILCGRLTRDPLVRDGNTKIARYTLAVDRRVRRDENDPNQQTADFIQCIAFGNGADFAEKYLRQGTKILIRGHIQTGRYVNSQGVTVYTTEVVVEDHEFVTPKNANPTADAAFATEPTTGPAPSMSDIAAVPVASAEGLPFD